jgi:hypothetical protein
VNVLLPSNCEVLLRWCSKTLQRDTKLVSLSYCPTLTLENCTDFGPFPLDYPELVPPQVNDLFSRVDYTPDMNLAAQIAATGNDIRDVKMIIMGHLHLDHAGGLEPFRGTGVPVHVHELELKHAFYSVATKSDLGVYFPHYLTFDINWVPFHGSFYEIAPGLNIHHSPGLKGRLCWGIVGIR